MYIMYYNQCTVINKSIIRNNARTKMPRALIYLDFVISKDKAKVLIGYYASSI